MSQIPPCIHPVLWLPPSSRPGPSPPILSFCSTSFPHPPAGVGGEASNHPPPSQWFPGSIWPLDRGVQGPTGRGGCGWERQRSWILLQHSDPLWGDGHAATPPNPSQAASSAGQFLPACSGSFERHELEYLNLSSFGLPEHFILVLRSKSQGQNDSINIKPAKTNVLPVCHQSSYLGYQICCFIDMLFYQTSVPKYTCHHQSLLVVFVFMKNEAKWRYSTEEVTETSVTSPLHHSRSVSISFFSLQPAVAIGGAQHAEELQCEWRDLHAGAHRRQPVRHSAGHGWWWQQEEAVQPQRTCGGHRRQPSQPQHFTDQRPRWVVTAYPTSCVWCECGKVPPQHMTETSHCYTLTM